MLTFITANLNRSIKICNKNHVIRRLPVIRLQIMQSDNGELCVKRNVQKEYCTGLINRIFF